MDKEGNMEQKEIGIREMLQITVDDIKEICVPVALADQIARPLCAAVCNIEAVIAAIKDEPKEGD